MTTRNEEIKAAIKAAGVYHYEVAEVLGISENYLSSLLHRRLSDHQKSPLLTLSRPLASTEQPRKRNKDFKKG